MPMKPLWLPKGLFSHISFVLISSVVSINNIGTFLELNVNEIYDDPVAAFQRAISVRNAEAREIGAERDVRARCAGSGGERR